MRLIWPLFMTTVGLAGVGLALFMIFPVLVNLPDSWLGAVFVVVLAVTGLTLVTVHGRRLWTNIAREK